MSFVFLSYSREDTAYAKILIQAFQQHNLPIWFDEYTDDGTTWTHVLQEKIGECQVFLLVMTPRSFESHWVQCELAYALKLEKRIFPLLLEGTHWLSVAALQTVDVTNGALPPDRFFDRLRKLVSPLSSGFPILPKDDDLSSARDIDYTRLRDLLKSGNWQAANEETCNVILRAIGKDPETWWDTSDASLDLLNLPCTDLLTIDRLWLNHSQGQFGFSVQKKIYLECGGKLGDESPSNGIWRKFGKAVDWSVEGGWIHHENVIFEAHVPPGHLPMITDYNLPPMIDSIYLRRIFSRLQDCGL